MISALRNKVPDMARFLIEQGADTTLSTNNGKTLIQCAVDEEQ